jgi:hypothetical protein
LIDHREKLGHKAAAVQIPIGIEHGLQGIIDIINERAFFFKGDKGYAADHTYFRYITVFDFVTIPCTVLWCLACFVLTVLRRDVVEEGEIPSHLVDLMKEKKEELINTLIDVDGNSLSLPVVGADTLCLTLSRRYLWREGRDPGREAHSRRHSGRLSPCPSHATPIPVPPRR